MINNILENENRISLAVLFLFVWFLVLIIIPVESFLSIIWLIIFIVLFVNIFVQANRFDKEVLDKNKKLRKEFKKRIRKVLIYMTIGGIISTIFFVINKIYDNIFVNGILIVISLVIWYLIIKKKSDF